MKTISISCFLSVVTMASFAQETLWQGKGRIAIRCDGNEHDHDDWGATPLSLAIIAAKGLQSKLSLYIYADHIWGSNHEHPGFGGVTPYQQIKESAVKGGKMFGFKNTKFIAAVDNPEVAYNALIEQINQSSENNPLFVIESYPVHVNGEALNRSDVAKRKYVTIITTLNSWNDSHADKPYLSWENHSGYTLHEIKQFEGNCNIVEIQNQAPYLERNWKEYEWLLTAPERNNPYYKKNKWEWLFNKLCLTAKNRGVDRDYYYAMEPTDAGKVIFLLTGIQETSPKLWYDIMRNPLQK